MPFWFWNDQLTEAELLRQIADFEAHGVYGFVIHPRVGLPDSLGWMSDQLLRFYDLAITEAERRGMYVLLYDEGMYPSGSSHGQVAAANPAFATRALVHVELPDASPPALPEGHHLVALLQRRNGKHVAIIDRPNGSTIRGLHYLDEAADAHLTEPRESRPLAADLLNPDAVDCFIRLVYDRFAQRYQQHFGKTVLAIFTDEPNMLGKFYDHKNQRPGTTGILAHVQRLLGYDFTPHLLTLWYDDEPDAQRHRAAYAWALEQRLFETYYSKLRDWCAAHRIPLTGHPMRSDDLGALRYFQLPGQDMVWRQVVPGKRATEGADATQAKCSASAALHLGARRNSNECCGAYGAELTEAEMKWIADWCFVRGVNLLYPHAFYYSVRGPRVHERPPDVGPHSPWWSRYADYAHGFRRLSWLNTDSTPICSIAILGENNHLGWRAAKTLLEHQLDFHYLEIRHLFEDAAVDAQGIRLAGMHYRLLVIDDLRVPVPAAEPALRTLEQAGRLLHYAGDDAALVQQARALTPADLTSAAAQRQLRYRHVRKLEADWYLLFNEGDIPLPLEVTVSAPGPRTWIDPYGVEPRVLDAAPRELGPYQMLVLRCGPDTSN